MQKRFFLFLLSLFLLLGASSALCETLDLTDGSCAGVKAISAAIDAGTDVTEVDLTGVPLSFAERKQLLAAYPHVHFRWTVEVCGVTISSEDTEVDFEGVDGKKFKNLTELCNGLDCLPNLEKVYMWTQPIYYDERKTLHSRYPDIFFGWDMQVNKAHRFRTDITAYSTLGRTPAIGKWHMINFTYCPNLLALDVGHCTVLDLSFLRDCNKLKILIVVDAGIKDLSPLESQPELEYLELFMNNITDISPLAKVTSLRDVNLSFNDITDLSPLYELPNLERVWVMGNFKLKKEEIECLKEHQPDCEIVDYCYGSTGDRMIKKNGEFILFPGTSWRDHPHYDTVYYIFNVAHEYVDWDYPLPADLNPKR